MRRTCAVLALTLAAVLLTACAAGPAVPPSPTPGVEAHLPGDFSTDVYRIVDGVETGRLVLAYTEGGTGSVFTLDVSDMDLAQPLTDGMLVDVTHNGVVQETYPLQWAAGAVRDVRPTGGEAVDDRCGLYLQVLEDLWEKDPGLNENITQLGVDLSGLTGLTESEKAAVAYVFGSAHGILPVTGTWEELRDQGYFTADPLEGDGAAKGAAFYHWEDGVLFSIATDTDAVWSLPALKEGETMPALTAFEAQKWRSSLGAYWFTGCTASMAENGSWSYTVGGEAIS